MGKGGSELTGMVEDEPRWVRVGLRRRGWAAQQRRGEATRSV